MKKPAHVPDAVAAGRQTVPAGFMALRGPAPIAFARGRVGQLAGASLAVWDVTSLERPLATLPLAPPAQAIGALADGSLVAVSPRQVCVLAEGKTAPECASKLTVIPYGTRTRVWGQRDALWILEVDVARKSKLAGGAVEELGDELKLGPSALAQMAPLSDGSVAWTNDIELIAGAAVWSAPKGLGINHVAEGPAGSAWVSLSDGTVALISFSRGKPEQVRAAPVGRALSLAGSVGHVAAVVADEQGRVTLVVLGADGKEVLRAPVPFPATPATADDLYVALSAFAPLVAVGGGTRLALWDLTSGKLVGTTR